MTHWVRAATDVLVIIAHLSDTNTSRFSVWVIFYFQWWELVLNLWLVPLHSTELSSAKETHVQRLQADKPIPRRHRSAAGAIRPSRIPTSTNSSESPSTSL